MGDIVVADQIERNIIVRLEAAKSEIAAIETVPEAKSLRDKAAALRQYAKSQNLSLEIQNRIAETKIDCERAAGKLLAGMELDKGGRPKKEGNRFHDGTGLSDFGVSNKQSHRWQAEASVPAAQYRKHVKDIAKSGKELTTTGVLRIAKEMKREVSNKIKREAPELPSGPFRVVYADPPWSYGNANEFGDTDYGRANKHYPPMKTSDLCNMGVEVRKRCSPDCVLFLWVTSPLLEDGLQVLNAWGFKYKSSFVWDKVKHNFAHYNSMRHEFLLIATRGSCTPDVKKLHDSVQSIERTKHSKKPDRFREIIDSIYTHGSRVELFARAEVSGWSSWGSEC